MSKRRRGVKNKAKKLTSAVENVDEVKAKCSGNFNSLFQMDEAYQLRKIQNLKDSDMSILVGAVILGKTEMVLRLLKDGHDVNEFGSVRTLVLKQAKELDNSTAIMWAIKNKNKEMIQKLFEYGADFTQTDLNGDNAIFIAIESTNWDETQFLELWNSIIRKKFPKIDINYANKSGNTLLHFAVKRQWPLVVQQLIKFKVNVNSKNMKGVTSLMMAGARNNSFLVNLLLSNGADMTQEDERGCTALCYTIAYIVQKQIEPLTSEALIKIVDWLNSEKVEITVDDYLQRRLELLISATIPPQAILSIIVPILNFFIKSTEDGLEVLLGLNIFGKLKEAVERDLDSAEYVNAVLACVFEVVRFCKCCTAGGGSHLTEQMLMDQFVINGGADLCLTILKKYEKLSSSDSVIISAWMPLIVACIVEGEAQLWLQTHYRTIIPFYQKFSKIGSISCNFIADEDHVKLVNYKMRSFHTLINKLEKEESICIPILPQSPHKQTETREVKPNSKRMKRKTKAWKAKIAKIRSADVAERVISRTEKFKEVKVDEKDSSSEGVISDNEDETIFKNEIERVLGLKLKYLNSLLEKIIATYEQHWKTDRDLGYPTFPGSQGDGTCEKVLTETREEQVEKLSQILPQLEASYLNKLREKFDEVVEQIKETAYTADPYYLEMIEHVQTNLQNHEIRGQVIKDIINKSSNREEIVEYHLINSVEKLLDSDENEPENSELFRNGPVEDVKLEELKTNFFHILSNGNRKVDNSKDGGKIQSCSGQVSRWDVAVQNLRGVKNLMAYACGELRTSPVSMRIHFMVSSGGNFGEVELGLDAHSRALAVKRISKQNNTVCKILKNAMNPLLGLRHKHLLHYAICDYDKMQLLIASPLCEYNMGEYLMYLKMNNLLSTTASLARQLLIGLRYLHERSVPIVHGNLKPSNVLIDATGVLKLAEFGVYRALYQTVRPPKSSIIWFARETYQHYEETSIMSCTTSSDIQVGGMLLHFILTGGLHPFGVAAETILENIIRGSPDLKTVGCDLIDLISWMLIYEPAERPNVSQVLSHVYFWDADRKWRFLLTCAGITQHGSLVPVSVSHLHATLDASAHRDHIKGDWVSVVKLKFPGIRFPDGAFSDTPTGLLRFLRASTEERQLNCRSFGGIDLQSFFIDAFPALPLSLFRLLETTEWLKHPVFQCFTMAAS